MPEQRTAIFHTLAYYLSFIALGLTSASLGPTLLNLSEQTESDLSRISMIFAVRSIGYLCGSYAGGRIFDRFPKHLSLSAALIGTSAMLGIIPLIPQLFILCITFLLLGIMEGVIDVGGNTLIVWVHRERTAPYMNGLHLFFAIGAFASPLLIAKASLIQSYVLGYWLLAGLLLFPALLIPLLPDPTPTIARDNPRFIRPVTSVLVMILACFLLFSGAEQSFAGWIAAYAVKAKGASMTEAAYLTSAFWGAFTAARIAAIPIALYISPRTILISDVALSFVGLGTCTLFPASETGLWAGIILFGFGIASAFPTMLILAGNKMTITGSITSYFFIAASAGSMTLPWIIGQGFESQGPKFLFIVLATALFAAAAILLIFIRSPGSDRNLQADDRG